MPTIRQLPHYQCHKKVRALKIKEIRNVDDKEHPDLYYCTEIVPEEKGYAPIKMTREYMSKHKPQSSGYYVEYEDGYKSYSPAKPFEEGYTKIS